MYREINKWFSTINLANHTTFARAWNSERKLFFFPVSFPRVILKAHGSSELKASRAGGPKIHDNIYYGYRRNVEKRIKAAGSVTQPKYIGESYRVCIIRASRSILLYTQYNIHIRMKKQREQSYIPRESGAAKAIFAVADTNAARVCDPDILRAILSPSARADLRLEPAAGETNDRSDPLRSRTISN